MSGDKATLDDAGVRAVLKPFCDQVSREVKPARPDPAGMLVEFMAGNTPFINLRREMADANVMLSRARRPGSATRGEIKKLEGQLLRLESDRQKVLAQAASSAAFETFKKQQAANSKKREADWMASQELATRARAILLRDRIPAILKPETVSVAAVVEAVENHVEAAPPVGSLILIGAEPRPSYPEFQPISAWASGLNARMFQASVRLAVAPGSPRGEQAEVDGAVQVRDALVMQLSDDRRPTTERHWEQFDDILPLATRRDMEPLIPVCVPFSSPYSNLRSLLSVESWRSIRDGANDRNNNTCALCGSATAGEVRPHWTFLEPLRGSGAFGIQRLDDVRSYCSACFVVMFPDPTRLTVLRQALDGDPEHQRDVYEVNPVMRRLARLNRWEEGSFPDPLTIAVSVAQEAYARRSTLRWALDLAFLHDLNIQLHPDMVMHRKGWIMRKSDVPLFDSGRSVHLTRIFGASFVNTDGRRCYFALPPTHEVAWNTSLAEVRGDQPVSTPQPDLLEPEEEMEFAGPSDPDDEDYVVEEGPPLSMS